MHALRLSLPVIVLVHSWLCHSKQEIYQHHLTSVTMHVSTSLICKLYLSMHIPYNLLVGHLTCMSIYYIPYNWLFSNFTCTNITCIYLSVCYLYTLPVHILHTSLFVTCILYLYRYYIPHSALLYTLLACPYITYLTVSG